MSLHHNSQDREQLRVGFVLFIINSLIRGADRKVLALIFLKKKGLYKTKHLFGFFILFVLMV